MPRLLPQRFEASEAAVISGEGRRGQRGAHFTLALDDAASLPRRELVEAFQAGYTPPQCPPPTPPRPSLWALSSPLADPGPVGSVGGPWSSLAPALRWVGPLATSAAVWSPQHYRMWPQWINRRARFLTLIAQRIADRGPRSNDQRIIDDSDGSGCGIDVGIDTSRSALGASIVAGWEPPEGGVEAFDVHSALATWSALTPVWVTWVLPAALSRNDHPSL
jgi:hypothetical protein